MKNVFVLLSLILTATYSAAIAAASLGVVSFRLPSLSVIIGTYAAIGVLAFAFRDYARQSRADARPTIQRSPRASMRPAVHPLSLTNPTIHAN